MTRTTLAMAGALALLASSALAQLAPTGGAGNTGVSLPPRAGGVNTGRSAPGGLGAGPTGNTASGSNSSVPGTTPGVNIGGTPTAGPPGTGGTAGGIGGVNK